MASNFTLNGATYERGGKWGATITLRTPDGRETKLDSEPVYECEAVARASMNNNLDRILAEFRKDGVEVISRDGLNYQ